MFTAGKEFFHFIKDLRITDKHKASIRGMQKFLFTAEKAFQFFVRKIQIPIMVTDFIGKPVNIFFVTSNKLHLQRNFSHKVIPQFRVNLNIPILITKFKNSSPQLFNSFFSAKNQFGILFQTVHFRFGKFIQQFLCFSKKLRG
ncbi:MAG: hypothetical protein BWX46_00506 [Candidatus Cloacimonetes bacterium ADurb.Bin003]|nr:MAG: hypothetical protein BWX46_00506 [Candidatus Cloacimonetes bacterium ADurb.Bin003]